MGDLNKQTPLNFKMASGVVASPDLVTLFNSFKLNKTDEVAIKCGIDGSVCVKVDAKVKSDVEGKSAEERHEEVLKLLSEDEPCFLLEDFITTDGINKVIFIKWIPDSAGIKKRMLYASSVDGVKTGFVGISKEIQGSDFDDISYEEITKIFAAI